MNFVCWSLCLRLRLCEQLSVALKILAEHVNSRGFQQVVAASCCDVCCNCLCFFNVEVLKQHEKVFEVSILWNKLQQVCSLLWKGFRELHVLLSERMPVTFALFASAVTRAKYFFKLSANVCHD